MNPDQQIFTFILILARVSSFVAFLPLFARKQLPNLVKAGLAMALTIFWFGSLPQELYYTGQINVVSSFLNLAKEVGIGFLLSILVGFMFIPARIAGAYVGQEVGLSLASVSSPGSMDSSALVTTIFETFAILLFFGLNFHHFMITLLHYSIIQLGGKIELTQLPTELLVQLSNSLSEYGSLIVGPVGVCLFILTVGLALLNKAAPSLNLFSVGMTLRSGIGIVCLIAFMPIILKSIEMYFTFHQSELEKFVIYFE